MQINGKCLMGVATALVAALGILVARPLMAQTNCSHSRVLVVLDKSSSMVTGNAADGQLKWDAARAAVETLVQRYGDTIDFGLMLFPDPSECSPGSVTVDVGPNTAAAISAALATPPPASGNYTPMAESLDVAATYAPLLESGQRNYVLLVTDGWQWCDPYDVSTRFDAVTSVENLALLGIDTFVLGFGATVDVLNNNRMAHVGNTAIAGCNPEGSNADATDLCYYQTESQSEIEDAFDDIAGTIVDETCDNQDNDCDGFIDNNTPGNPSPLTRNVSDACGICASTCSRGVWSTCSIEGPCDDSNACTTNDYCKGASCAGTPVTCDDGKPCTADSCVPESGCRHVPVADGTACSTGDPCTTDTCVGGVCTPGPSTCSDGDDPAATTNTGAGLDRGCGCAAKNGGSAWVALMVLGLGLGTFIRRRR